MRPIFCIQTEIEQVFLNLLKNSAQAMSEKVWNQSPKITIRINSEKEHARIDIEDNGTGMDEAIRKRIFEPFFTTKPVGIGTGLGLSISYMIITSNHDGTIEASSELGKGTVFTIRLPFETN